jgi:hypothetical protein
MLARVRKTATNALILTPPPGKWTGDDARLAVSAFEALMTPEALYVFVGDVTEMTDYETEARHLWQALLKRRRHQFRAFWAVGTKVHPVVRMGIITLSVVLGIRFRFVTALEDVPELASYAVSKPTRR